jgi:hypothetical protein
MRAAVTLAQARLTGRRRGAQLPAGESVLRWLVSLDGVCYDLYTGLVEIIA